MNKFIFVRHGQSEANANKTIATDSSKLTKEGLSQARITGKELANLKIKTILCSPLIRAQQTAETIAGELGIDVSHIKIVNELSERELGDLKGRPKEHLSNYYFTVENEHNVEPRDALINRMKRALTKISEYVSDGVVLVVGHAISGYYLIEVAEGKEKYSEFEQPTEILNADFVIVEHKVRDK